MNGRIALVLAIASNGMIGRHGTLPWRLPEDLRHFRAVTMGKPVVMGRKTWEGLPKKPLPGRTNIVLTRDRAFRAEGAVVAHTLDEAIARAEEAEPEEIAVIGGAEIFKAALPRAGRLYLTEIHAPFDGDTHFAFDRAQWRETARQDHANAEGLRYSFVTLDRR